MFYLLPAKSGWISLCRIDLVIEDLNLLAGDFRHKRQNLGQAIEQSNLIELILKQQNNTDNNLYTVPNCIPRNRYEDVTKS